jgi:hypothetical protein
MTVDELLQYRARRPFQPYRVLLKNGDSIDILKTTSLGCGKTQVHMFYPDLRRHRMVHIDEVASVELLQPVA